MQGCPETRAQIVFSCVLLSIWVITHLRVFNVREMEFRCFTATIVLLAACHSPSGKKLADDKRGECASKKGHVVRKNYLHDKQSRYQSLRWASHISITRECMMMECIFLSQLQLSGKADKAVVFVRRLRNFNLNSNLLSVARF